MSNEKQIRQEEQLGYLKQEFAAHVIDSQEFIRETRNNIRVIEERSIVRNKQMEDLNNGIKGLYNLLNDDKYSTRKGITSQTLENTDRISKLELEAKAWKRVSVLLGTLFTGLVFAGKYLWEVLKQLLRE